MGQQQSNTEAEDIEEEQVPPQAVMNAWAEGSEIMKVRPPTTRPPTRAVSRSEPRMQIAAKKEGSDLMMFEYSDDEDCKRQLRILRRQEIDLQ
ncbi:hypothetical protein PROFUN_00348 [Planoprotostelium fungivorum]|uniref:Uncharacterized protein n=1 Tax=Planoprotostelium fungivorum TaxID=1890364 RepID=A0A2P6NY51_9EUKA|nr:hypothetical protein PROFUN_00348 [Planoprotostelium fungivorum]